jgi:hypothetical protein
MEGGLLYISVIGCYAEFIFRIIMHMQVFFFFFFFLINSVKKVNFARLNVWLSPWYINLAINNFQYNFKLTSFKLRCFTRVLFSRF